MRQDQGWGHRTTILTDSPFIMSFRICCCVLGPGTPPPPPPPPPLSICELNTSQHGDEGRRQPLMRQQTKTFALKTGHSLSCPPHTTPSVPWCSPAGDCVPS